MLCYLAIFVRKKSCRAENLCKLSNNVGIYSGLWQKSPKIPTAKNGGEAQFPASDLAGPVADSRMIRFVDRQGEQPKKRQAEKRLGDWQEIYQEYDPHQSRRPSCPLLSVWRALLSGALPAGK